MDSFLTPYGLSNSGQVAVHTFLGWSQAGMLRRHLYRNYRKPELFCLRSYPAEISHPNSPNQELSNDFSDVVVRRRKVAPVHTLRQLKRDEALFPPLGRVVVSSVVPSDDWSPVFVG